MRDRSVPRAHRAQIPRLQSVEAAPSDHSDTENDIQNVNTVDSEAMDDMDIFDGDCTGDDVIIIDVKPTVIVDIKSSPQYSSEYAYEPYLKEEDGVEIIIVEDEDATDEQKSNFKLEMEEDENDGDFDEEIEEKYSDGQANLLMCETCGGVFKSEFDLRNHDHIHCTDALDDIPSFSDVLPVMCEVCGNRFKNMQALERHEKLHAGMHDHDCNLCPSTFNSRIDLQMHLKQAHKDPQYICDSCNRGFNLKSDIEFHFKKKNSCKMDYLRYACPTCGLKFAAVGKWIMHNYNAHRDEIRARDKDFDLEVQINGMKFDYLVVLNSNHTIRTYKCKVCKKGYSKYPHLYQHYTKHWEQRPYICSECNRGFYYRTSLKQHLLVHQKKPYKCEVCLVRFKTAEEKTQHMGVAHTKVNISHGFSSWRTAIEGKLYKCEICPNMYTTKESKEQHIRRAHNNVSTNIKARVITFV